MIYFDTSYIVRLYTRDSGWREVRELAAKDSLACCLHGHVETVAAFHRKLRERAIAPSELLAVVTEFESDCARGSVRWLPLTVDLTQKLRGIYTGLPSTVYLRAADAIHLACAAANGFREIYSNDGKLLDAAVHFGLEGRNVIAL